MDKWEYQIKQWYLENRVVREPCKQRTACIFINIGIFEFGSMLDLHARRVAVAKSWEPRGFEGVVTLENLYYTSNYQSAF